MPILAVSLLGIVVEGTYFDANVVLCITISNAVD
jgi:hypothetical protein